MGAVKLDLSGDERRLDTKYALDDHVGVRLLLSDYNALVVRQYQGDYDAVTILIDLATAIERAGLTDKQRLVLRLTYIEDLAQVDTADRLGISKQTVNRLISVALTKVARVYEYWARHGEGYSLTITSEGDR